MASALFTADPGEAIRTPDLPSDHPCAECEVRALAVCGVLERRELDELREGVLKFGLDAERVLAREGDPSEHLFTVSEGALRLSKLLPDGRRQITGFLFKGDFLGITLDRRHAYTVETLRPSRFCRFPRQTFEGTARRHPHLERRLYEIAAHELAQAQAQMVILGRKTPKERLASFLLWLDERLGDADGVIALPMRRGDIADYLGLTKETVSRVFTACKTAGLIRLLDGDRVRLLDRARLNDLAEGVEA